MVSSVALANAEGEGFEPEENPPLIEQIAANSQQESDSPKPSKAQGAPRSRPRRPGTAHASQGPPDDLEKRIGDKLFFSINELAALAGSSPATIFRLLRQGLLPFVQVGGSRRFTRAIVLEFLRHGTRNPDVA